MNNTKKEDGYILIVVVGILMVFSMMAITFAKLSRVETKAARNYADSVKCDAVAKAGLEHAIYEIRLDKFGTDTTAYNDDSGDTNYDYPGDASWPGNDIFPDSGVPENDYDNDGDSIDDSQWVYIPGTTIATSAIRLPGSLRARYAVLITDDREARININATGNKADGGSHASNEGWSTFEIGLADLIDQVASDKGTSTASSIIDARHGAEVNPAPGTFNVDDDSAKIPDPATDGIDNDGDLTADEVDEDTDEPDEFNPIFPIGDDVPFDILTEVETMDTSAYTSELEGIFTTEGISQNDQEDLKDYLTTYSADTILCPDYQLDGGTSTTMLNINALINNDGAYDDGEVYYDSDKKVKMLIDVLEAGGVTGAFGSAGYIERHQLAVNIKDFIDTDSAVTTYSDGTDIYYGVDKTPYINEVEADPGDMEFIELYNPYDTTIDIGDWTITGTSMGTVTITTGASIDTDSYYVIADVAGEDQHVATMDLEDNGEELTLRTDPGSGSKTVQVTNYGNESGSSNNTCSLNDPRPIPLTALTFPPNPWSWSLNESNTMGAPNSNFRPEDGDDDWDGGTYLSSFLIANRRFSNKGYLGYIHRGEEWASFRIGDSGPNQIELASLNLLQYITITDPSMDGIDNDGDDDIDTYDTDGDGDIDENDTGDTSFQDGDIDGQEYRIPGLINVNTASVEVLESLPGVDNAIASGIENPAGKPYESIGHLVKNVSQITGALPKWNEEETIRAISNLITTRSNVFTVYVTAQVTDDAGTDVFAEKKIKAIVDRSVNPIRVSYFRWITE